MLPGRELIQRKTRSDTCQIGAGFLIKEKDTDAHSPQCPVFSTIRQGVVGTRYTKGCFLQIQKSDKPPSVNYESQLQSK